MPVEIRKVPRKFNPIPYEKFMAIKKCRYGTNCLAFALGITRKRQNEKEYSLKQTGETIETIFLRKVKELGFNPNDFVQISPKEESEIHGYIIRVYSLPTTGDWIDFHVIRREPDGRWVHKPGYFYLPEEISYWGWYAISQKYGERYVSFAVKT